MFVSHGDVEHDHELNVFFAFDAFEFFGIEIHQVGDEFGGFAIAFFVFSFCVNGEESVVDVQLDGEQRGVVSHFQDFFRSAG